MEMEESIEKVCKPTASQEAKLPNYPLARESEIFLESNNDEFSSSPDVTPSEPTGIVVLSLPDSPCPVEQDEGAVFVTPPEHHYNSQLSSSEDQNPNDRCAEQLTVAEAKVETKARVSEVGLDDERGEEFDGDTVPLGETEVVVVGSGDCAGETRTVSIVREIGGLLSSGDAIGVSPKEAKKAKQRGKAKKAKQRGKSGGVESSGKRIEEIDEFRYVSSVGDGVCQGRSGRKLPPSMGGKEKEKEKVVVESSEEKSGLFDFLEAVIKDGGCDPKDGDYMATAKERGIEIPRPRWWPSEADAEMEFFS